VNYFAEVEQIAFDPAHLVPGIEPSHDKMLQGRLFSYGDTHRHRLGVNYQTIPVNCPYATKARGGIQHYERDGHMRVDGNQLDAPNYFPNSFNGPQPADPEESAWNKDPAALDPNDVVARFESGGNEYDNFSQVGLFYRKVLSEEERDRLTDNIAAHLANAYEFIQVRAVANFTSADANYGRMVQHKLAAIKRRKEQEKATKDTAAKEEFVSRLSPPRIVPGKNGVNGANGMTVANSNGYGNGKTGGFK
jgi:catalase